MAFSASEDRPRRSAEFADSSVLEAVVPQNPHVDLQAEIRSWDASLGGEEESILSLIPQRSFLLFDELVPVYIILRTPFIEDATLKSFLARLAISLESFAISGSRQELDTNNGPAPKELIFSETIKPSQEPLVVRRVTPNRSWIYVAWKVNVFISRPRSRFQKPVVYFTPTASLKPPDKGDRPVPQDEYLPAKVPSAVNLLQSFAHDPALGGIHPRLSALRISKVAPTAPVARELARPIRSGPRRLFRAIPVVVWRVRHSKLHGPLSDDSLITSLDLEVTHMAGCEIRFKDVKLALQGGQTQAMSGQPATTAVYRPGDQILCLYKLTPGGLGLGVPPTAKDGHILTLNIQAQVFISGECRPEISVEWKTHVDFTAEPATRAARMQSVNKHAPQLDAKAPDPDSLPANEQHSRSEDIRTQTVNFAVTISGPPTVRVGETFNWQVFIVNRSEKSRKLAALVISKRRSDSERHRTRPSISGHGSRPDKEVVANAVLDDNIVYAKQKSAKQDSARLVCLTTDVRIGHLAPGGCYTAELQFLALSSGVLSIEAIRIVDLNTQDIADVREVPTIVAVE